MYIDKEYDHIQALWVIYINLKVFVLVFRVEIIVSLRYCELDTCISIIVNIIKKIELFKNHSNLFLLFRCVIYSQIQLS